MDGSVYVDIIRQIITSVENLILPMKDLWIFLNDKIFFESSLHLYWPDIPFDIMNLGGWFIQILSWLIGQVLNIIIWIVTNANTWVFEFWGMETKPMSIMEIFFSSAVYIIIGWSIVKSFII